MCIVMYASEALLAINMLMKFFPMKSRSSTMRKLNGVEGFLSSVEVNRCVKMMTDRHHSPKLV